MNWTLALPEIVLACCGMAILLFGVLQKRESFHLCSMLTVGAFLLAAVLVIAGPSGQGYHGLFTTDRLQHLRQAAGAGRRRASASSSRSTMPSTPTCAASSSRC